MSYKHNKYNSLLVGIFTGYWLFVFYAVFFASPNGYIKHLYTSSWGSIIFPSNYHMVTSVPNQTVKTYYNFYAQDTLLYVYNVDSAYHQKLKKSFPSFRLKKELKRYNKLYATNNITLGNTSNKYAYDTVLQNKMSLQQYLLDQRFIKQILTNQLNNAYNIKKETAALNAADSVYIKILKKYIYIEEDPDATKNFEYWVQDSVVYQAGKSLDYVAK